MPLAFQLGADSALARCADLYCRLIAMIRQRELSMGTPVSQQTRDLYWRENRRLMLILGFFWFVVSLGCGVLWVEPLNRIQMGGFKLGFWFAQQGAIYGFILLTFIYAVAMARLEKRLGLEEPDA